MEKKKRRREEADIFEVLGAAMMAGGGLISMLGEVMKDERDVDKYHLGHGLYLLLDKNLKDNSARYCHLVRVDNSRVSDVYFRLGGLSYGFKNKPYCQLIVYPDYPTKTWGLHCIIDKEGKIVLQSDREFDTGIYYHDGVIATKNETIYNLLTGKPIVKGNSRIESTEFYFVEHKYNYDNKYPLGVYKIDKNTGEYEIFQ